MIRRKRDKKGSGVDLFFMLAGALFASILILMGFKIMSEINDGFSANSAVNGSAEALTAMDSIENTYSTTIDNMFLFLIVGLGLAALALASLVRVHPIFFVFFVILWIFIMIFAGIISNIYQEVAADPNLVAQANELTFISNILEYLPIIIGVFGTLLAIVMYKSRTG